MKRDEKKQRTGKPSGSVTREDRLSHLLRDVVLERAVGFSLCGREYRLYPVTLAKLLAASPHAQRLGLGGWSGQTNPYVECLRLAERERELCCHVLALHCTPNTRAAFHDEESLNARRGMFEKEMCTADVASLLLHTLTADNTQQLLEYLGLDKERERMQKVMEVKKRKHDGSLSFGGLSLFGTFIGPLKEMGYTDDEILYERGYSYLRLMLADRVTSVYLTDEELQEVPTDLGGTLLSGDDPENAEGLQALLAERGIRTLGRSRGIGN